MTAPLPPQWHHLESLGLLFAQGEDAQSFLQGQLTNSLDSLGENHVQHNGYCSPKGRLLASFILWRGTVEGNPGFFMAVSRDIQAAVQKRLSMFVLRAKCKLQDLNSTFSLLGSVPEDAHLEGIFGATLAVPGSWQALSGGGVQVRLPDGRALACVPHSGIDDRLAGLRLGDAAWVRAGIRAGVPCIDAATQDKFVPQMVNFELIGGVDFKQGCYPGQEIVARSQYLSKLKRRMFLATCAVAGVRSGEPLFGTDEIGQVVNAVTVGQASELLVELPTDALEHPLHLRAADGPLLQLHALPYDVPLENTAFKRPKL
jgi:tRNA-modifying protein YgfZ